MPHKPRKRLFSFPADAMIIERVQRDDWIAAMQHALARLPEEVRPARVEHCAQLLANGVLNAWVARERDKIVAVQVCAPLGGAACLFWLPSSADACADRLVEAALEDCRTQGCKLAQALAKSAEQAW